MVIDGSAGSDASTYGLVDEKQAVKTLMEATHLHCNFGMKDL